MVGVCIADSQSTYSFGYEHVYICRATHFSYLYIEARSYAQIVALWIILISKLILQAIKLIILRLIKDVTSVMQYIQYSLYTRKSSFSLN